VHRACPSREGNRRPPFLRPAAAPAQLRGAAGGRPSRAGGRLVRGGPAAVAPVAVRSVRAGVPGRAGAGQRRPPDSGSSRTTIPSSISSSPSSRSVLSNRVRPGLRGAPRPVQRLLGARPTLSPHSRPRASLRRRRARRSRAARTRRPPAPVPRPGRRRGWRAAPGRPGRRRSARSRSSAARAAPPVTPDAISAAAAGSSGGPASRPSSRCSVPSQECPSSTDAWLAARQAASALGAIHSPSLPETTVLTSPVAAAGARAYGAPPAWTPPAGT
jgi:hypothetical protein